MDPQNQVQNEVHNQAFVPSNQPVQTVHVEENPKKLKMISYSIGVVVSLVVIVASFFYIQGTFIRAEGDMPQDVIVAETTQNSSKITWTTGRENQSVIEYGTTPVALNFFAPEANRSKSHSLELTLLSPNTTYYFQIRVNDKKYDNGGAPWTFATKGQSSQKAIAPSPSEAIPGSDQIPQESELNICESADCEKIKEALGASCTSRDYAKCIAKAATVVEPSLTLMPAVRVTPTLIPTSTPSATITPSVTPTITPTPTPR